ncbi:MAG: VWA domain-containing protein, partial [Candidatus Kapabacteria bacterium]|nr:VWA domain-containing protein [Candidatus Kapabacteria bacterium]
MESISLLLASGPWWMFVLTAAIAGIVSWYAYRVTTPPLPAQRRTVLVILRAIALMCLLLALFEPILHVVRSEVETPTVAVLVDRSRSLDIADRSGARAQKLRDAVRSIQQQIGDRARIAVFDDRVELAATPGTFDTVTLRGSRTDIGAALRWTGNNMAAQRFGGVVLVTDGNTNSGDEPVGIAERNGLPVLTVGIGDSVAPSDISIQSIDVPSTAVVGEQTLLGVDLAATSMQGNSAEVILSDDGREIGRQRVDLRERNQRQNLVFAYTPTSAGTKKITASVSSLDGEISTKNNTAASFLNVRSNKRGIVLIAGAPSPDVAFMRDALGADPTVRLQVFVQRQGGGFYGNAPTAAAFTDAAAIILVGFPVATTPTAVVGMVADAARRDRSLLFISSQDLDYSKLGPLADVLPFSVVSARPREMTVTADVTGSAAADPIMRLGTDDDAKRWNDLPPLYRTETFVDVRPQATVLATQRLNGVPMGDPLIVSRDDGERRQLAVLGHGIYRWRLLGKGPADARNGIAVDALSSFVDNSVRWLSANADRQRIRIAPTRSIYAAGEVVGFSATVNDATNAAVDDADVRVSVSGGGKTRDIVLASLGNGRYRSDLGVLPAGDYQYTGTAMRGTSKLGSDAGRFSVGDVNVEFLGTTMNVGLLRSIAEATNGTFVTPSTLDAGMQRLLNDRRLADRTVTSERDIALWSSWWLLALAIALFSAEWFLRKRSGLV